MSRQSEYKKKFDPELGKFRLQHIYGEDEIAGGGIKDVFKNIGAKLFGQPLKTAAKKKAKAAATAALTKTGEYAGKKAGDKIVQMLSKEKAPQKVTFNENAGIIPPKSTQQDINRRVNAILSGGGKRRGYPILYNY